MKTSNKQVYFMKTPNKQTYFMIYLPLANTKKYD